MKFTDKKLIIFDLDGTLIDSSPDLALAVNQMLKEVDRPTFTLDTIHHWVGNGATTLVKRALSGASEIDPNLDENLFQNGLKIFLDFYAKNLAVETTTYPDVLETLNILKERGYHLAMVTNKPFAFVAPILSALKLEEFFELILGGDSLERRKPDPLPLLHVCKTLNISLKDSLMIGDSKNDILAADAADIQSIGLSYGYNYGEDIERYRPDIVLDNFSDILTTLIYGE